jgi:hypothetical protein
VPKGDIPAFAPAQVCGKLTAGCPASSRYLAEAEKLSLEVTPVSGERIQSLIADVYRTTSAEISAKIEAMMK